MVNSEGIIWVEMVVGTTRATDATMIREDMMFVRTLLNATLSTPKLAKKMLLPRTYRLPIRKTHVERWGKLPRESRTTYYLASWTGQ